MRPDCGILITLLICVIRCSEIVAEESAEPSIDQKNLASFLAEQERSRGKFLPLKENQNFDDVGSDLYPESESLGSMVKKGFVPMRGRREEIVPYSDNDVFYQQLEDYTKRAFQPMRGKKSASIHPGSFGFRSPINNLRSDMMVPVGLSRMQSDLKDMDNQRRIFSTRGKRALTGSKQLLAARG
ncbi:uncharacterized protein LOC141852361 [Brevipalpus obovatus]|uniref:uncharacterized protein LOC141852361 n=1 Tax=Brevipalpus obovatus TaxID=246614 RepID=UPI003D9E42D9